ncbi:hypothetical protein G5714_013974 [Onychostoma macrolepis]|uniref:Interleukin 4 n=2 Tax=Onychostoma macrolepis TaxID=369639 RepID=A0A7J6CDB6_9TELE|nr:hypothetical protein G5714_013974 [Onychostoma macrolepis]
MSVNTILKQNSKEILNQFVKDIFPQAGCSEKHLCQAAKVMMHTNLKRTKLHRQLSAYANNSTHHPCSIPATEEHRMKVFLTKIKECSQEQHSKLKNETDVK